MELTAASLSDYTLIKLTKQYDQAYKTLFHQKFEALSFNATSTIMRIMLGASSSKGMVSKTLFSYQYNTFPISRRQSSLSFKT